MYSMSLVFGLMGAFEPTGGVALSCLENVRGKQGRARVEAVIAAGVLHEGENERGVAHLVEHLIFRPLGFDDSNGATSWDYTTYYRDVAADRLNQAAQDLLSAMAQPKFSNEDFDIEKKVVLRELEDRGVGSIESGVDPWFEGTLLARSPGGSAASVRNLTAEDARDFHRRFYHRGNLAVVLRGAVSCSESRAALQDVLSSFSRGSLADLPQETRREPGPRTHGGGGGTFMQGYYWYDAKPEHSLVYRIVVKHLEQEALRVLRKERGLTYSPQSFFERRGRGGRAWISIKTQETGEVEKWYQETIEGLRTSDEPKVRLANAVGPVVDAVRADAVLGALAHLRREPPLETVFSDLSNGQLRQMLGELLQERRGFGTANPQSNLSSLLILVLFSLVVLGVMGVALRSYLSGG